MSDTNRVKGHCPMGCGRTLSIGHGVIQCNNPECPRPQAVSEILAENETHHVIEFTSRGFDVLHPLKERLDRELLGCPALKVLGKLSGPPEGRPGRYRLIIANWPGGSVSTEWEPVS